MFINCRVLLLFSILSYSVSNNLAIKRRENNNDKRSSILIKVVVTLLQECNHGLQAIQFVDRADYSTFNTLPPLKHQIAVSQFSDALIYYNFIESNLNINSVSYGIIFKLDFQIDQGSGRFLKRSGMYWHHYSTVITIFEEANACSSAEHYLQMFKRMYISKAYYICLLNTTTPIIFTHDIYGDTKPVFWNVFKKQLLGGNHYTIYKRIFQEDNICKNFFFERTNPSINNSTIVLTVNNEWYRSVYNFEGDYVSSIVPNGDNIYAECELRNAYILQRLMQAKFQYYIMRQHDDRYAHFNSFTDIMFKMGQLDDDILWSNFHPCLTRDFAIISYNQGLATPLEKIAHFYGPCTLISLVIFSVLTFIVIWLKTGRNIYKASFDVLRLLINSGIYLPINTASLKIFFTMIFLYFLIIQATFSGHLAEFLTKVEYLANTDSVKDAMTSKIKTIFTVSLQFLDDNELEVLANKIKMVQSHKLCILKMNYYRDTACVDHENSIKKYLAYFRNGNDTDRYYLSNNLDRMKYSSIKYRRNFPFAEKFNWAFMYLDELKVLHYERKQQEKHANLILSIRHQTSQIDYRPISIQDIMFSFVVLAFGCTLGLICFIFENLIGRNLFKWQE